MKGDLWTIAVVLVFLAMLLPAVGLGFEGAAQETMIEDEAITLEHNATVEVEHNATATNSNVTLVDSGGTELERGTDYEWDAGLVTTLNEEYDGESASISYVTETQTEVTHDVSQILSVFDGWIAIIFLFVVVGAIFAMAFGGSNFGGR